MFSENRLDSIIYKLPHSSSELKIGLCYPIQSCSSFKNKYSKRYQTELLLETTKYNTEMASPVSEFVQCSLITHKKNIYILLLDTYGRPEDGYVELGLGFGFGFGCGLSICDSDWLMEGNWEME